MRIFRSSPGDGFTIIPNATLQDDRLSHAARGVLVQLLSRPDGWATHADSLWRHATKTRGQRRGEGREATRGAFAELEEHGYLVRQRLQGADGKFTTELHLYDTPGHQANRRTANRPSVHRPSADQTSVSRTSKERTDQQSTDQQREKKKDIAALVDTRAGASSEAREDRLERIYEVVNHLSDAVIKDTLLKFERHRPQIYRDCRRRALAQFERTDARILNQAQAAREVDNLSFKYGVLHYEAKQNWPGWMTKPLQDQHRRDQRAQAS